MKHYPSHHDKLIALKRIEGQIRGIQKMVEGSTYCIDIVTQIHAAINALYRVSEGIFEKHIEYCVVDAFGGKSVQEKTQKIREITEVIKKLHKS
jgi:DNA-binding FrmR family transcriptional regulator